MKGDFGLSWSGQSCPCWKFHEGTDSNEAIIKLEFGLVSGLGGGSGCMVDAAGRGREQACPAMNGHINQLQQLCNIARLGLV